MLQNIFSVEDPWQLRPPFVAGGLLQERVRIEDPPLQDREHIDQLPQGPQFPPGNVIMSKCQKFYIKNSQTFLIKTRPVMAGFMTALVW